MGDSYRLYAECDGSGNSPKGSAAACVLLDEDGVLVAEKWETWAPGTNNVAEYKGVHLAMRTAIALEADELEIHSDSQLIVNQILENWDCKDPILAVLRDEAHSLGSQFDDISISWFPREKNKRADLLCRKALKIK